MDQFALFFFENTFCFANVDQCLEIAAVVFLVVPCLCAFGLGLAVGLACAVGGA